MLHSPEPWEVESKKGYDSEYNTVVDAKGDEVTGAVECGGDCYDCSAEPCITSENVNRIIACVNALAGIPACDLPKVRALWDKFSEIEPDAVGNPEARFYELWQAGRR